MNVRLWMAPELSQEERAITDSLKALRTLRCQAGRVSIDPDEVLGSPTSKREGMQRQ